jgi:ATP-dependent DNA helicase PIF1
MNKELSKATALFNAGKNILMLGSAGTGKSTFLNRVRELSGKKVAVTSTTGISAFNIKGCTIHSFSGIGTGDDNMEKLLYRVNRGTAGQVIREIQVLIIDEISMLSAELFEKLNYIYQQVRNSALPFGGLQLIFSGDLLQLQPVFNRNEGMFGEQDRRLIFQSPAFKNIFSKHKDNIVVLQKNYRQDDPVFISMLMRVRIGNYTEDDIKLLDTRRTEPQDDDYVELVVTNKQALATNMERLNRIDAKEYRFSTKFTSIGDQYDCEKLIKELTNQFKQREIFTITLKVGARVMLIKNLDTARGLINGTTGNVIDIASSYVSVKFDHIEEPIPVEMEKWDLEYKKSKVVAEQIPLILGYSVTTHKSQSLTLEKALLDLDRCFCDGQVYVALSRLRSLDGLYLKSFNPKKIKCNKLAKGYLDSILE